MYKARAERAKLVEFVFTHVTTTENKARDLLFLSLAFVIEGFLKKIWPSFRRKANIFRGKHEQKAIQTNC